MRKSKIIFAILLLLLTALAVSAIIAVVSSAPIANDLAVDQLNGGSDAWYTWQAYSHLRNAVPAIGALVILCTAIPLIKIIFHFIKEKTK